MIISSYCPIIKGLDGEVLVVGDSDIRKIEAEKGSETMSSDGYLEGFNDENLEGVVYGT